MEASLMQIRRTSSGRAYPIPSPFIMKVPGRPRRPGTAPRAPASGDWMRAGAGEPASPDSRGGGP